MANRVAGAIRGTLVRVYALVIVLVLVWTFYAALSYLVRTVFSPRHLPERYVAARAQLVAESLRKEQAPGVTGPAVRAPAGHYHGVPRWFDPDTHEACTMSGCHLPIPHDKNKRTRAFANLHATFLTCEVCHDKSLPASFKAVWVNNDTGAPQETPAMLTLLSLLETAGEQIQDSPAAIHPRLSELARQVADVSDSRVLNYLAMRIDSSQPGSPVWRQAVEQLEGELPNHARGEYGARLRPELPAGQVEQRSAAMRAQAREYLAAPPESEARKRNRDAIHQAVLEKPDACVACHGGAPARLDLEVLGYSPERAAYLRSAPVARMVQGIREGRDFYLPRIEGGEP